jgi:hypothetical protein
VAGIIKSQSALPGTTEQDVRNNIATYIKQLVKGTTNTPDLAQSYYMLIGRTCQRVAAMQLST